MGLQWGQGEPPPTTPADGNAVLSLDATVTCARLGPGGVVQTLPLAQPQLFPSPFDAGEGAGYWRVALMTGKVLTKAERGGRKFSEWCLEMFPGLRQNDAASAIWFAENSTRLVEIPADISHPPRSASAIWFAEVFPDGQEIPAGISRPLVRLGISWTPGKNDAPRTQPPRPRRFPVARLRFFGGPEFFTRCEISC